MVRAAGQPEKARKFPKKPGPKPEKPEKSEKPGKPEKIRKKPEKPEIFHREITSFPPFLRINFCKKSGMKMCFFKKLKIFGLK